MSINMNYIKEEDISHFSTLYYLIKIDLYYNNIEGATTSFNRMTALYQEIVA